MRAGAGGAAAAVSDVRLAAVEPDTSLHSARTVQTDSLLGRLCRVARDMLGVSRATVLVFDEPGSLVPAVSVAREEHEELWQRFRSMRPISLDLSPTAAEALARAEVVVVPDATASPLVPAEWRVAFSLTSLAVAPLHVDGRSWGALVVDDGERRHEFGAADVRTLGELAVLAATAIAATERAAVADSESVLRTALRSAVSELAAHGDLAAAVDSVAPFLLEATGYELLGAALRDNRLARLLNVGPTSAHDPDVLRRLRQGVDQVVASGGRLVVPLTGWTGVVGLLVLRPNREGGKRLDLVHEVAERLSAVVEQAAAAERAAMQAATAEHAAARLGLARTAITQTLRTFRGVGYATARGGPALFSVSSTNHARRALDDLDVVRLVLAAQAGSPSIAAALRSLLEPGPAGSYELHFSTSGAPRQVAPDGEIACLRSAVRFLNLVRETRGRILSARVSFTQDSVECLLSSNGLLRDPASVVGDRVTELVGPWVSEFGGTVDLQAGDAAFSVRLVLPDVRTDRTSTDRRLTTARARARAR